MSDSSTGGFLLPTPKYPSLPGNLNLREFLQTVFTGISGLPGDLVRPRWQPNPPKQPDLDINWMALGLNRNKSDANAYVGQSTGQPATGFIHFVSIPKANDTVTINGVVVTFVTGTPSGSQVQIGSSIIATVLNLASFLKASSDPDIREATYSAFYHDVMITAVVVGASGNAFTLASSSAATASVSGATLSGGALGGANLLRHEDLEVECSFYGPDAYDLASLVRDGFQISQNRESLQTALMDFVEATDAMHVPDLVNERWIDRFVMTVMLRREVIRVYPILEFTSVSGSIQAVVSGNLESVDWQTNT